MTSATDVACVFPGQGAFNGKTLASAARKYEQVAEVFSAIDHLTITETGQRISDLVLGDRNVDINSLSDVSPWASQLAIYGSSVAAFRILVANGVRPCVLLGHSFGEIAALTCGGAYTIADGAAIVFQRTKILADLLADTGYMAALSIGQERTQLLIDLLDKSSLSVAAINEDAQTVVSGTSDEMDLLGKVVGLLGISHCRLDSPYPFHSPLLRESANRLAEAIRDVPRSPLQARVFSPILERDYEPEEDLAVCLAEHLVRPVQFRAAIRRLRSDGFRLFAECGTDGGVARIIKRILDGDDDATVICTLYGNGAEDPASEALEALRVVKHVPLIAAEEKLDGFVDTVSDTEFATFWHEYGQLIMAEIHSAYRGFKDAHGQPSMNKENGKGSAVKTESTGPNSQAVPPSDRDRLSGELRALFARELEYPEEFITPTALLEEELGVDSLKQTELLTRAAEKYGLDSRNRVRGVYATVDDLVEVVYQAFTTESG